MSLQEGINADCSLVMSNLYKIAFNNMSLNELNMIIV